MKCPHCGEGLSAAPAARPPSVVGTFTIVSDPADRVEPTPILLVACNACDKVLGVVGVTPKALGVPRRD